MDISDIRKQLQEQIDRVVNLFEGLKKLIDNKKQIEASIANLQTKKEGLQKLEFTIALTGKAKAGKSTLLNALIGQEISPQHTEPMTVVPTKYIHDANCSEPELQLQEKGLKILKNEIFRRLANNYSQLKKLPEVKPFEETLNLLNGEKRRNLAQESCRGTQAVSQQTKHIHHTCRLLKILANTNHFLKMDCKDLIRQLLGSDFMHVHVNMAIVKNIKINDEQGQFTIWDTAGFDEALLAEELTETMPQLLEKANGIVCVLDAANMGTNAQEQLSKWVKDEAKEFLFLCLNKMDQYKEGEEKAKDAAQTTFSSKIAKEDGEEKYVAFDRERIFCTAGQLAWNCTKIAKEKKDNNRYLKPKFEDNDLGEYGLYKRILGEDTWEDIYEQSRGEKLNFEDVDMQRVQKSIEKNIEKSGLPLLANDVFVFAYKNKNLLLFKEIYNALGKELKNIQNSIERGLKGLDTDPLELQKSKDKLEDAKKKIAGLKKNAEQLPKELQKHLEGKYKDSKSMLRALCDSIEEKYENLLEKFATESNNKDSRSSDPFAFGLGNLIHKSPNYLGIVELGIVEKVLEYIFDNMQQENANSKSKKSFFSTIERLGRKFETACSDIIEEFNKETEKYLRDKLEEINKQIQGVLDGIKESDLLKDYKVDGKIDKIDDFKLSPPEVDTNTYYTYTTTYRRAKTFMEDDSGWAIINFFKFWDEYKYGYETITETNFNFERSRDEFLKRFKEAIKQVNEKIIGLLKGEFSSKIAENIEVIIAQHGDAVNVVEQAIADKKLSEEEQEEKRQKYKKLRDDSKNIEATLPESKRDHCRIIEQLQASRAVPVEK